MTTRVMVTGAHGQVGLDLVDHLRGVVPLGETGRSSPMDDRSR